MKNAGHGEGLIHLLTAIGFFLLAGLLLLSPESITIGGALGIMAFLLGLKTIANLIIDSHNKIHYHGKSEKATRKKK